MCVDLLISSLSFCVYGQVEFLKTKLKIEDFRDIVATGSNREEYMWKGRKAAFANELYLQGVPARLLRYVNRWRVWKARNCRFLKIASRMIETSQNTYAFNLLPLLARFVDQKYGSFFYFYFIVIHLFP